jgi:hypothetical protein
LDLITFELVGWLAHRQKLMSDTGVWDTMMIRRSIPTVESSKS